MMREELVLNSKEQAGDSQQFGSYSFTEFLIKPELMLEYTTKLVENRQHEELKQLARYYIDLFILQYAKIPNPNNQGFEEQLVMQNKRLRVYTRLLVYVSR